VNSYCTLQKTKKRGTLFSADLGAGDTDASLRRIANETTFQSSGAGAVAKGGGGDQEIGEEFLKLGAIVFFFSNQKNVHLSKKS
jgi:hypothetical protein